VAVNHVAERLPHVRFVPLELGMDARRLPLLWSVGGLLPTVGQADWRLHPVRNGTIERLGGSNPSPTAFDARSRKRGFESRRGAKALRRLVDRTPTFHAGVVLMAQHGSLPNC
jgi:hypothetical protein